MFRKNRTKKLENKLDKVTLFVRSKKLFWKYYEWRELKQDQYVKIEKHLPKQRGSGIINNLRFFNPILYVVENGRKLRALAKGIRLPAYDIQC